MNSFLIASVFLIVGGFGLSFFWVSGKCVKLSRENGRLRSKNEISEDWIKTIEKENEELVIQLGGLQKSRKYLLKELFFYKVQKPGWIKPPTCFYVSENLEPELIEMKGKKIKVVPPPGLAVDQVKGFNDFKVHGFQPIGTENSKKARPPKKR